jgi:hypothetical protein
MAMPLDFASVEMTAKKKVKDERDERRGYFLHRGFFSAPFLHPKHNSACLAAITLIL